MGWESLLRPLTDNRWVLLVVRIALGGLLITSAASKFHDQAAFKEALLAYGMLPDSLGTVYAAVLPWVELLIGCCLVLGVFLLFAFALTIPLVLSFTIANIYAMVHPIGEAADCSCLGSLVRLSHPTSLVIDFGMLLAAALLVAGRRTSAAISLGSVLDGTIRNIGTKRRTILKVSLVALLVLAIVAMVPVDTVFAEQGVDRTLKEGNPVLLYLYEADEDLLQNAAALTDIQANYGQVNVVLLQYREVRSEARQFRLKALPTLLVITGKSRSGSYVVSATFEGLVDKEEVMSLLDALPGR
jgi:uncharacterized membrane protein YphA (DoxX/SURF4 family)